MVKRKRVLESTNTPELDHESKISKTDGHADVKTPGPVIQIVAGSYERVLHGITASLSDLTAAKPQIQFADSFLFNAHASAIRCLAISSLPTNADPLSPTVLLATGGSDERVNIYSLSASPMVENDRVPAMPNLGDNQISENPANRELGSLVHHTSNITSLHFATRSKLLSASEDNTISICRTRDLTVVSTVKAPNPKTQGQPSGDTAPIGITPAGINDFAIHPSMKLMVSVGRGEKCMRLWNLVTGKKAGVLNFERAILRQIKESKYSSGEGRKIRWDPTGTEFVVSFERGAIVYGPDSKPKCVVLPEPLTKIHQMNYHPVSTDHALLAVSTEDGRVIFYDTSMHDQIETDDIPPSTAVSQLGGKTAGVRTRVKDFKILNSHMGDSLEQILVVTACSDGSIRVWSMGSTADLARREAKTVQTGSLIGTYETGNRITCLEAFMMLPANDEAGFSEFEDFTEGDNDSESESDVEAGR